jgi:hypothetical protein
MVIVSLPQQIGSKFKPKLYPKSYMMQTLFLFK